MNTDFYNIIKSYSKESFLEHSNIIDSLLIHDFNEIMINSWNQVFIEKEGRIIKKENVFSSVKEYKREVAIFLAMHNQRLSVDKPIINFELRKMYRVHVVNSNISGKYPIITIRKNGGRRFNKNDFIKNSFATEKQINFLQKLVKEKKNIFISGETSSGKTTFLNFLLKNISENERLIVIEDTNEIEAPKSSNVIYLRTKEEEFNVREVTTSDLVKASLRMRPDRIILGEIRRDEVLDFLHAINTGHDGSISTGHGSSPEDMIIRLEMLLLQAGVPYNAAKRYLGRGIDYIIQLSGKRIRKINRISHIYFKDGEVIIDDVG